MRNNWTMVFDHDDLYWPEHYTEEDKLAVELNLAFGFPDEYGFVDGHAPEYNEDDDEDYVEEESSSDYDEDFDDDEEYEDEDYEEYYDDEEYEGEEYYGDFDVDEAVLGDEIEGRCRYCREEDEGGGFQSGIVVGQIRNRYGKIVCYKVCHRRSEDDDVGVFDYINAYDVTLSEPYGNTTRSLERIGYHFVEDTRMRCGGYYINDKTGDVIYAKEVMR